MNHPSMTIFSNHVLFSWISPCSSKSCNLLCWLMSSVFWIKFLYCIFLASSSNIGFSHFCKFFPCTLYECEVANNIGLSQLVCLSVWAVDVMCNTGMGYCTSWRLLASISTLDWRSEISLIIEVLVKRDWQNFYSEMGKVWSNNRKRQKNKNAKLCIGGVAEETCQVQANQSSNKCSKKKRNYNISSSLQ